MSQTSRTPFEFNDADVSVHRLEPVMGSFSPIIDASVPGSKSLTNRYLLLASLAHGESSIRNALDSEDSRVMQRALNECGCLVRQQEDRLVVNTPAHWKIDDHSTLFVQNAGTAMRFLTAAVAVRQSQAVTLDGNKWMRRRPQADLIEALRTLGAEIVCTEREGYPPLRVQGPISGGRVELVGSISSQFLSALLMALPGCINDSVIHLTTNLVSRTYVEMTISCMERVGIQVEADPDFKTFRIPGNQKYRPFTVDIEPDASTASYWFAVPAMLSRTIRMASIPPESTQGDFGLITILENMGIDCSRDRNTITIKPSSLQGVDVNMNTMSDVAPTLAVIATQARSTTRISDIGNMRVKECDRIAVLQEAFDRLGLVMRSGSDWIEVDPGPEELDKQAIVELDPHEDHRMAMVFALLGLRYGGIRIKNYACVDKTYPDFYRDFQALSARF